MALNETSTEYKKIVFIVVVVSAIVSLVTFMRLSMWTEFSVGNKKLEELEIASCSWSENLDSATISIKNTGETALGISQLRINNTLLSHEEWVCYPNNELESGDERHVLVSSSTIAFKESSYYTFALTTESGKTFTHTFATPLRARAGKIIKFDSASINAASDNVTIYVRNWGTEHVTIDTVYIEGANYTRSVDQTWPMSIPVDGVVEVTLSGGGLPDFREGSAYRVKVAGPGVSWEERVEAL